MWLLAGLPHLLRKSEFFKNEIHLQSPLGNVSNPVMELGSLSIRSLLFLNVSLTQRSSKKDFQKGYRSCVHALELKWIHFSLKHTHTHTHTHTQKTQFVFLKNTFACLDSSADHLFFVRKGYRKTIILPRNLVRSYATQVTSPSPSVTGARVCKELGGWCSKADLALWSFPVWSLLKTIADCPADWGWKSFGTSVTSVTNVLWGFHPDGVYN